jgi:hypothetical protein
MVILYQHHASNGRSLAGAPPRPVRSRGSLMIELLVAMAILVGVVIPLGWSIASERRLARALYQRAIAMEILDGEMEALVAGEWRAFEAGQHDYHVSAAAVTNLPPGKFVLTLNPGLVRLEWQPSVKHHGGALKREAQVK